MKCGGRSGGGWRKSSGGGRGGKGGGWARGQADLVIERHKVSASAAAGYHFMHGKGLKGAPRKGVKKKPKRGLKKKPKRGLKKMPKSAVFAPKIAHFCVDILSHGPVLSYT